MNLLVVGSVALDSIETPAGKAERVLGGSAVYFSVAASFFADVGLVAVIGRDFPEEHIALLQQRNVDLRGLTRESGLTFYWKGRYNGDLNEAESLETQLNVFETFRPVIPPEYQSISFVFLANIDPELQLAVLRQVKRPKLTVCDTMNFWIQGKEAALRETIQLVDILIINEGEARLLSRQSNLIRAYHAIAAMGPKTVVIKKGSHGALLFTPSSVFAAPAYLLETVTDPTGAGDSFAGGFTGYLARAGRASEDELRRAVIYGSVMASFNVEGFSLDRMRTLRGDEVENRFQAFQQMTRF